MVKTQVLLLLSTQCPLAPFAIAAYSIATLAVAWVPLQSSRHPDFQSMPNLPIFLPLTQHTLPSVQKDIVQTLSILHLDY